MATDTFRETVNEIFTPPTAHELKRIRGMAEPWKNQELEAIALRVARLAVVTPEKWAIVDALHELDGRISTDPKGETCPSIPKNA